MEVMSNSTTVLSGKGEELSWLAKYQTVHVTGNTVYMGKKENEPLQGE